MNPFCWNRPVCPALPRRWPSASVRCRAKPPNGKALVGFGIVTNEAAGKRMFDAMPQSASGSVASIGLCPLRLAPRVPDVVVVEGPAEVLMGLVLGDLNVRGGERRTANTAVLQAACVDATVIPHLAQRLNFSLGCYGCREVTDLKPGETVVGFPGALLDPLLGSLEKLLAKAIPRSRSKLAYAHLAAGQAETKEALEQENIHGS